MEKTEFVYISWEQLYLDTLELSKKIAHSGYRPDVMVAIARGGWVVGRILSDLLGIREVYAVTVKFYRDVAKPGDKPTLLQELNVDLASRQILVVDDIVDTGETLKETLRHIFDKKPRELKTAALYVKSWSPIKPDFYVREYSSWVVFPYEIRETLKNASLPQGLLSELKKAGLTEEILRDILGQ
jgi:hypoxanthine phosphoribosyltransferase